MKYINFLLSLLMPGLWIYAFIQFPEENVSLNSIFKIIVIVFGLHIVSLRLIFKGYKEDYQKGVFWIGLASTALFVIVLFLKHSFLTVGIFFVVTIFFYITYFLVSTEELFKKSFKRKWHQKEVHSKYD